MNQKGTNNNDSTSIDMISQNMLSPARSSVRGLKS